MPALSFQQRFVRFVETGSKTHSIRAERKRPFRAGDTCHLYTAMRTKQCRLLGRAPCVKVEEIRLWRAGLWINGEELSISEKDSLAWRDGFRHPNSAGRLELTGVGGCFDLMLRFWAKAHGDIDFRGQLIHWDWARRVNV